MTQGKDDVFCGECCKDITDKYDEESPKNVIWFCSHSCSTEYKRILNIKMFGTDDEKEIKKIMRGNDCSIL